MAGMKAMLTGVFAKAAEAKGKAVRKPAPAAARQVAAASAQEPAVRLSLGPEAAEDATARSSELLAVAPIDCMADRLEPAIQALARDLGRLLNAFGMSGDRKSVV